MTEPRSPGFRRRLRTTKSGSVSIGIPRDAMPYRLPGDPIHVIYIYPLRNRYGWYVSLEPLPGVPVNEGW